MIRNTLIVDGVEVAIAVWPAQGEARGSLLALHGFASDGIKSFYKIGKLISRQGIHVLAPDLPGFGQSARLPSYSLSLYSELLTQLASSLEPPVVVLGHSMGAKLALAMCLDHPGAIDSYCLVNPGGFSRYAPWLARFGDNSMLVRFAENSLVLRLLSKTPLGALTSSRDFRESLQEFAGSNASLDLNRMGYLDRMGDLELPGLLLWGDEDPLLPSNVPENVREAIPGIKTIIIPRSGHAPIIDSPRKVASHLLDWFSRLHENEA